MRPHVRMSLRFLIAVAAAVLVAPITAHAASPPDAPPWVSRDWIMSTAAAQNGKPYVWGANGPDAFDCSGFVSFTWKVSSYYGGTPRLTTDHYYNNASGAGAVVSFDIPGTSTDRFSRASRGDALVYRSADAGHMLLFRNRNADGSIQTWEARGSAYGTGSWSRSYSSLVYGGFKAIRRRNVDQPGRVSMVSPTTPGNRVRAAGVVRMQANAEDEDGVAYVQFSKTGPLHLEAIERWYGKATSSPYTWDLDTGTQIPGDYRIGARVVDPNPRAVSAAKIDVSVVSHDRVGGTTRYETAVAVSRKKYPNGGAFSVVLVRGDDPADAMSSAPLAAYWGGVVLYVQTDVLPEATRAEISRLAPAQVIVVGGANVISDYVLQQAAAASSWGATAVRLAGANRYGTAQKVREYMGKPRKAVLVNRDALADAMAVSSGAAYRGYSILLCTSSSIPAETAEAIRDGATEVIVIGSTSAIDPAAWSQIPAGNSAGEPVSKVRVAGADRYGTAVAIANADDFDLRGGRPHLVNGADTSWPDGLSAGPLAGPDPTLLVGVGSTPPETRAELQRREPSAVRLIGSSAVTSGYTW